VFLNCRKVGKFGASIEHPKTKSASALGEALPLTPDQGLCPSTPLGALAPDPRYTLVLPRSPWGHAPTCCGLEPPLLATGFFAPLLFQELYLPCARTVHMQSQSVIYHGKIARAIMAYF